MSLLSIVAGTYNEEGNVTELYDRACRACAEHLPGYDLEFVFIDNASTDRTVEILKSLAAKDRRVRIIVNNRNFGPVRSGYHAVLQARGDAIVAIASDLQDPPELIPEFVRKWEEGYKLVLAQKTNSEESALFFLVRKIYYSTINKLSDIQLVENSTGFGLYDRRVIEDIRNVNDPYPYLRGLICDLGYERALIQFTQPLRKRGFSKSSFYALWDLAMLGITNHSKVPLRLAIFSGLIVAGMAFLVGFGYLIYKLLYWDSFQVGQAPLILGIFFIGAVQLIFIGLLGEYIGSIHTQILRRPPVIEKERINFDG